MYHFVANSDLLSMDMFFWRGEYYEGTKIVKEWENK